MKPQHVEIKGAPTMDDPCIVHAIQDLQACDEKGQALRALAQLARKTRRHEAEKANEGTPLASALWSSFGTVSILISELVQIYPQLPYLATAPAATYKRAASSLRLIFYLACDHAARAGLLSAGMLELLYPLLYADGTNRRITSLRNKALYAARELLQDDNREVNDRVVRSEIIPLCLGVLEARAFSSSIWMLLSFLLKFCSAKIS